MLVTTLLDHRRVSKDDLRQFYARRWNVELDLRNLKTTTGMYVLRCQTPQLNEKQLWVHLLAYNVIRLLLAQAASNAHVDSRNLSFKHTVQRCTEWVAREPTATHDSGRLFALIAQCQVGHRPGRIEPRMRKKEIPILQRVESQQDVVPDRSVYWTRLEEMEGESLAVVGRGDKESDAPDLVGVACFGELQQPLEGEATLRGGLALVQRQAARAAMVECPVDCAG